MLMINVNSDALDLMIRICRKQVGWIESSKLQDRDADQYATSLHWAMSQFYGTSDLAPSNMDERTFACVALLCGFFADDDKLIKQLCHKAMRTVEFAKGDILFSRGEVSHAARLAAGCRPPHCRE